jgi:hypothetical protein
MTNFYTHELNALPMITVWLGRSEPFKAPQEQEFHLRQAQFICKLKAEVLIFGGIETRRRSR